MFEALMSLITLNNVGAAGVGGVLVVLSGMVKNGLASVFAGVTSALADVKAVKAKIDADAMALKMASIPAKPAVAVVTVTAAPAAPVAAAS